MSKIKIRFKSGRTMDVEGNDLPRIRNLIPSVQVVVETPKPPKPKEEPKEEKQEKELE